MDLLSALPWQARNPLPSMEKDERLIRHSPLHWIRYVGPVLAYLLLTTLLVSIFAIAFSVRSTSPAFAQTLCVATLVCAVVVHHIFFHMLLSLSFADILLTNKRVLYVTRKLWLEDASHDIGITKIKAVEVHRHGFLQNIFNYGMLWFDTGGSTKQQPHQSIRYLPSPQEWADDIISAMRTYTT